MTQTKPIIGVLALQGAVQPHKPHIEACGAEFAAVKTPTQFAEVDAFILPGGESTTMLKLIERFDLWDILADEFSRKPVWGICAGSILLAEKVLFSSKRMALAGARPDQVQKSFGMLPMTVERNGYGRQIDSQHCEVDGYEVSLIRAPVITEIDESVEILAKHEGDPIWVRKGHFMASTFHPEMSLVFPSPMHRAFIDLVREAA